MADQCGEIYERIIGPDGKAPQYVLCTFIKGHQARRHSWETLRMVDDQEAEATGADIARSVEDDRIPKGVRTFVQGIRNGYHDLYLELILAAAHDRKRARRGTLGFGRR